jgi:hypothetical protein
VFLAKVAKCPVSEMMSGLKAIMYNRQEATTYAHIYEEDTTDVWSCPNVLPYISARVFRESSSGGSSQDSLVSICSALPVGANGS